MGLSGLILKKKENTDIYKLIHDVRVAAEQAGLEPGIESLLCDSRDGGVYTFELNPDDYFYDELKWYYTHGDIVKIKQKEFDPDWCYKNPE